MGENTEIRETLKRMRLSGYQRKRIEKLIEETARDLKQNYDSEMLAVSELMAQVLDETMLASEMKSQFLASMSHELRTPLNSIIGFLELVIQGLGFDEEVVTNPLARQYLGYAHKSAIGLLNLINDLLDLSKIEAGRMEVILSDVNVRGLAESLHREYLALAEQKGIELRYVVDEAMPEMVKSDKGKLRSILVNLLGNAIKFTKKGYVEMIFLRNGNGWMIQVVDTGIGIDMEREKDLWEPFIQMDSGSSREYGGTGLGLAIVQRMCNLLDAKIDVESTLGKGSKFVVSLPNV
jgi:two-component system chemotaxis sensor kinase CheA